MLLVFADPVVVEGEYGALRQNLYGVQGDALVLFTLTRLDLELRPRGALWSADERPAYAASTEQLC